MTQKPRLSSLVLFIVHLTETFIRSMDRGPASANDVRSVSLRSEPGCNKPCETLTPGLALTRPWLPRTELLRLSPIASPSAVPDLMNNTPITENNALSPAMASPALDPARRDGDREIWNCLSSEINGSFLLVLRNSCAQKVHRTVPIHICPIEF